MTLDTALWALLAAAGVALWVLSRLGPGIAAPDRLFSALLARPTLRVSLLVGWMWLGWHAFAR